MTPHLVKWDEKYRSRGLQIVEIDNGAIDKLGDLKEHLQLEGVNFPVLHDAGGKVCNTYGVRSYPQAYLIGRDGSVLWQGNPRGTPEMESRIEAALN